MEIKTRQVVCDVCDCSETFDISVDLADTGWTRFNNIIQNEIKDLCPACTEKLKKVIDDFFNKESEG